MRRFLAGGSTRTLLRARDIFMDIEDDIAKAFASIRDRLDSALKPLLAEATKEEVGKEKQRLDARIAEIDIAMRDAKVEAIAKELEQLVADGETWLFEEITRDEAERKRRLEEELELRKRRYRELREYLKNERERLIKEVLPRRFALSGGVQAFPVGIEIILSEVSQ